MKKVRKRKTALYLRRGDWDIARSARSSASKGTRASTSFLSPLRDPVTMRQLELPRSLGQSQSVLPTKKSHMEWDSYVVVLARTNPNTLSPLSMPSVRPMKSRPDRVRVSKVVRNRAVVLYQHGHSTRSVGAQLGLAKSTVLGILKDAGVPLRPRGNYVGRGQAPDAPN